MKANEKPRQDKSGKRWNFHYMYTPLGDASRQWQRLFFWDDDRADCGAIVFLPGRTVPYTRIQNLIVKLVADPAFRKQHQRELRLPLGDHYLQYPLFPEEVEEHAAWKSTGKTLTP